jgi:hypothetical protein
LPASVELQTAVALDERAELQLPQGLTDLAPAVPGETEEKGSLERLTDEMQGSDAKAGA